MTRGSEFGDHEGPTRALRARVLAAIKGSPAPTREQHRKLSSIMMASSALPAVTQLVHGGIDVKARPLAYVALVAAGSGLAAALATLWAFTRPAPLGHPRVRLLMVAGAVPAILLLIALAASLVVHAPRGSAAGWYAHSHCIVTSLALLAAPLGASLYVFRRSDPVLPWATGAALGAVAASWGGVTLALQCPDMGALHVALAHAGPVALGALLGAVLGSRVLALRWIDVA